MGKVRNLSLTEKVVSFFRRVTAGTLAFFVLGAPLHGLADSVGVVASEAIV